jgi:hypothetical protein
MTVRIGSDLSAHDQSADGRIRLIAVLAITKEHRSLTEIATDAARAKEDRFSPLRIEPCIGAFRLNPDAPYARRHEQK